MLRELAYETGLVAALNGALADTYRGSWLHAPGRVLTDLAVAVADGVAVATVYHMNEPIPLPSGFVAKTWEIEIRGNQMVTGIVLAYTPTQIAEG